MKKILFISFINICCNISFAQIFIERQVIATAGSNSIVYGQMQASVTIGETLIQTFSQNNLIINQGFQHDEIEDSISVGIQPHTMSFGRIYTYPNPVQNKIILDFNGISSTVFLIEIFNEIGQLTKNAEQLSIDGNCKYELDFSNFISGNYFVVLKSQDSKIYKGFKVQKVN